MDRGAWKATVPGVTKNLTQLRDYHFHHHKLLSLFQNFVILDYLNIRNILLNVSLQKFIISSLG